MSFKQSIEQLIHKCKWFRNKNSYISGWAAGTLIAVESGEADWDENSIEEGGLRTKDTKKTDTRIAKKPIEIWKNIIAETPRIDLVDLDHKIDVVQKRMELLQNYMGINPTDEIKALGYLKARTKYKKHGHLFKWATTTKTLISQLCATYKVRVVGFNSYYKTVPNEALDELKNFMIAFKKVSGGVAVNPAITLVIDVGGDETKKDPILLAESPFGNWTYVLGAWDKEIEIVDDLIYNNK